MIARGGILVALFFALAGVAHAAPKLPLTAKLLDTRTQLQLTLPTLDAVWSRAFNGKRIPVDKRALELTLPPSADGAACDHATVIVDEQPVTCSVHAAPTGINCGAADGNRFGVRIERSDLAALQTAKHLTISICDDEHTLDAPSLQALQKLIKRALADR